MNKGIGEKVLGWFVVPEDEEAPPAAPPAPPRRPAPRESVAAPAEGDRLARVLMLLEGLPEATPLDVKRQIVNASLEAFGIDVDRMAESAAASMSALDARVAEGQRKTERAIAEADARIAKLTAEIAETRRQVDVQIASQSKLAAAVAVEKERLRGVVAFFGSRRPS